MKDFNIEVEHCPRMANRWEQVPEKTGIKKLLSDSYWAIRDFPRWGKASVLAVSAALVLGVGLLKHAEENASRYAGPIRPVYEWGFNSSGKATLQQVGFVPDGRVPIEAQPTPTRDYREDFPQPIPTISRQDVIAGLKAGVVSDSTPGTQLVVSQNGVGRQSREKQNDYNAPRTPARGN